MEIFFQEPPIQGSLTIGGTRLSTTSSAPSSPAEYGGLWCKCLTGMAFFAVIVGFPNFTSDAVFTVPGRRKRPPKGRRQTVEAFFERRPAQDEGRAMPRTQP